MASIGQHAERPRVDLLRCRMLRIRWFADLWLRVKYGCMSNVRHGNPSIHLRSRGRVTLNYHRDCHSTCGPLAWLDELHVRISSLSGRTRPTVSKMKFISFYISGLGVIIPILNYRFLNFHSQAKNILGLLYIRKYYRFDIILFPK